MKESAEITEEIVGKRENPLDGIDVSYPYTLKTIITLIFNFCF
jgi:small nuclear ribonucleoprotein (snRNP)-like protein